MREELDAIKAEVTAQGGMMLGHHTFSSEIQVLQIAMKECPQGDAFALLVDPVSIYCHDSIYAPVVGWEKTTKAMEESGVMSVTDRKVVASYNCNHAFWFTDGKPVVAGTVIGAFASAEKWAGMGGMDGCRVEMEMSSETAGDSVQMGIADKLPAGSKLAQLATKLLEHTQSWLLKVNKHLDSELTKLTQMNISPEEALILLSEEVIIMFDHFYTIRRKRMEFIVKGTRVQYMVHCIWLTMQVHMAMDEFVRDGMKCNLAYFSCVCSLLDQADGKQRWGGHRRDDHQVGIKVACCRSGSQGSSSDGKGRHPSEPQGRVQRPTLARQPSPRSILSRNENFSPRSRLRLSVHRSTRLPQLL